MMKLEFKEIMKGWILFHGKKFKGDSVEIERAMYNRHLEIYYESVKHMTAKELDNGFKQCVKSYEYYPKPSILLKFCPAEKKEEAFKEYEPLPQSEKSKQLMKNALAGSSKTQIGEATVRANFAMIAMRWPCTDWEPAIKREIERDLSRIPRND